MATHHTPNWHAVDRLLLGAVVLIVVGLIVIFWR
jgi:hypothetical protein